MTSVYVVYLLTVNTFKGRNGVQCGVELLLYACLQLAWSIKIFN